MTSTRSLRLGALSSAAVVLVGLALAAAQPASADASLQVVSRQVTTDSLGYQHIVGEILNSGTSAAAAHVDVLYTNAGTPSGSDQADAMLDSLAAGEKAPFDVQVDPGVTWDDFSLTLTPTPTPEPNHNFATSISSVLKDPGSTSKQITGSVRNDNTTPADDVTVVFTFYGADGKAVGGEPISAGSGGPVQPGASASFTETTNPDLPAWTSFAYVVQSSSPAAKDPSASPTPTSSPSNPPERTLNCNPTMTLSTKVVNVGKTTTVSISNGTPGSQITLEGYSRPSTTYAAIRNGVTVAGNGTAPSFDVRPPTSARVRLSVLGCSTTGTEQVIQVIPGLGITITRVGTRTYTFSGKIIPGKQNTGRAIALYLGSVKKVTVKSAADGSYKATLTLPRGATKAYWATGANMTNLAGKSAVKAFTVS
jgi:hypothetical protein